MLTITWQVTLFCSRTKEANPNVSGKDSTSSLTSVGSDGSTSSSSDIEGDFTELEDHSSADDVSKRNLVSLKVWTIG